MLVGGFDDRDILFTVTEWEQEESEHTAGFRQYVKEINIKDKCKRVVRYDDGDQSSLSGVEGEMARTEVCRWKKD